MKLVEETPFRWRMPRHGGMLVDGLIFASKDLLAKASEDRALEQVANVAHLPGIVGFSIAMPDIHWGYGFPIGGVAATDVEAGGVVSPGGVGFDIGCGVRLLRSSVPWDEASPQLSRLVDKLAAAVPRGVGAGGLRAAGDKEMKRVLTGGVRWAVSAGFGWDEDAALTEDGGSLGGADPEAVSELAMKRGSPQLGSLGAGNHFLEIQVVEEVYAPAAAEAMGIVAGQVCVMIHTGSRGIGHQICTEETRIFDRAMQAAGVALPDRQLACAPVESPEGSRYMAAMAAAANFARANRQLLCDAVRRCFEQVFSASAESLGLGLVYDVSHNIAKLEHHLCGGRQALLCVHRKGATRAFGPGHSEVPARYAEVGQPVIIPGSMGSDSFLLSGAAGSEEAAFSSTCHGAGRMMSRKKAAGRMSGQEVRQLLGEAGIEVRSHQARLLAEEAPYAYKDAAEVVRTCERNQLSATVARLRPVGVVKG